MRLLVVGGSGFIGRNVIECLATGNHPYTHVAATYHSQGDFPNWARRLGVEPLALDLRHSGTGVEGFDTAIFLAGNANHATAADQPLVDLDLNAGAMLRFLTPFRGRLVFLSSGAVYYGLQGAVHPGLSLRPTFAYGISKLASELYASTARQRGRLSSLTVLRLFYAFGRHDKPMRLVPRVLRAIEKQTGSDFRVTGTGTSCMDPLEAGYVAEALVATAKQSAVEGVFDLCGGANRTVASLVPEIARAVDSSLDVVASHEPEEYPVTFFASPQSLRATMNLPPPPDLRDGILRTREWLRISGLLI